MPWTKVGNIRGPSGATELTPSVAIGQNATLAIAAGVRLVTVTVQGLVKGERVDVIPLPPFPAGYGVFAPIARDTNTLDVLVFAPALVIGASYSFNVRVLVFR
jgi:hypothetical protein